MLSFLYTFNNIMFLIFSALYLYQFVYMGISLIFKLKPAPAVKRECRYAVMIAARNEETVIGNLIKSIKAQTYPSHLVDIFVVADNCTDSTAEIASSMGARVFVRNDATLIGKGYALDFAFAKMKNEGIRTNYDGFFVFDADNVLDKNYISEMHKTFCQGFKAVTSYRNSKNFDDNWISAGYSLWFLREAQYLNKPRMILGTTCAISGTGFLLSCEIIEKSDGWKQFLLTEDLEFNTKCALEKTKIGYCENAVFYDEQPTSFKQSWVQRMRWVRGTYQVLKRYGIKLFFSIFKGTPLARFDIFMSLAPGMFVSLISVLVNGFCLCFTLLQSVFSPFVFTAAIKSLFFTITNFYLVFLGSGAVTMITERKRIKASAFKRVLYTFTFPFYVLTYVPISVMALFKKVQWTPIKHKINKSLEELS